MTDRAGAIRSLGNVTIAGSTFNNNSVSFNGGAFIGNTDNQATIVNSTFANNQANNDGGAIHIGSTASTTSLINVTIAGNSAGNMGGGINRNMSRAIAYGFSMKNQ